MNLFSHRIELIDHLSYDEDELLSYFKTSTFISRYSFDPPEAFLLAPILWNDNWDNLRNYPMINNIVKQIKEYKNTIKWIDLLTQAPGTTTPPHIDGGRQVALNIPVQSEGMCGINIYKRTKNKGKPDAIGSTIFHESEVEKVASINYKLPVIINTAVPHGAFNYSNFKRKILTIGFAPNFNFRRIRELYKNDGLSR